MAHTSEHITFPRTPWVVGSVIIVRTNIYNSMSTSDLGNCLNNEGDMVVGRSFTDGRKTM